MTLNIENLTKLRNLFSNLPNESFRYFEWTGHVEEIVEVEGIGPCGSTGCIAGWAVFISEQDALRVRSDGVAYAELDNSRVKYMASEWLGLSSGDPLDGFDYRDGYRSGLGDDYTSDVGIMFYPFDMTYIQAGELLKSEGIIDFNLTIPWIFNFLQFFHRVTPREVTMFLDKVIETGSIKLSHWVNIMENTPRAAE